MLDNMSRKPTKNNPNVAQSVRRKAISCIRGLLKFNIFWDLGWQEPPKVTGTMKQQGESTPDEQLGRNPHIAQLLLEAVESTLREGRQMGCGYAGSWAITVCMSFTVWLKNAVPMSRCSTRKAAREWAGWGTSTRNSHPRPHPRHSATPTRARTPRTNAMDYCTNARHF